MILGIDIGGSGIKGNLVDPATGRLLAERHKIATPQPSTPKAVAAAVVDLISHFKYKGPIGCTFPAIVKDGVTMSAANVDPSWIGCPAGELLSEATGHPVTLLNDADAAGIAEMAHGAGKGRRGVVLLLTFGTGIGSALFVDGVLVPNTELGHIELDGHRPVEAWAAAKVRADEDLTWKEWGHRVDVYLAHLATLFSPDLFILGGGVSRKFEKFSDSLTSNVETVPAGLQNEAGIVGAAMAASAALSRDLGTR
jgi:polyphosphate glucokinase